MSTVLAGAAQVNITPSSSQFLFGYPNAVRYSQGTHDPLLSSALYLEANGTGVLFMGNDLIWVPRDISHRAASRIAEATDIAPDHVMITGTHTHSGPIVNDLPGNADSTIVPPADETYRRQLEDAIVDAGIRAVASARPALLAGNVMQVPQLGANRRRPDGQTNPMVPVLTATQPDGKLIAVMAVVSMHPTVLHEDWLKYSGDFPGLARLQLQRDVIGADVPFIYHMGCSGNQSPRHVIRGNTIDECRRLGSILANAIALAIPTAAPMVAPVIHCQRKEVTLTLRQMPLPHESETRLHRIRAHYEQLVAREAPRPTVRTAQCDLFGAQKTLTLARAAINGRLDAVIAQYMPAIVQLIRIGDWNFIGWPGEIFVEFGQMVMAQHPNTFIITLSGGDLLGYLVTQEAVLEGGYESSNAVFASPAGGLQIVDATLELLAQ